ncbi:cytochrome P450 [Gigaspora margarita]|uniref:Cytochrome P450 n=1 Tax=Gigaspora margarita TaxID=4874 RepID=A0A8H4ACQ1_GIGMA|nr:cytochrome P450 [Gigaspora margarita]
MEYYLCDSDYEPINVNDEYMEYLFEQLIVTLFAAFFTTVKVVTEALYEYAGRPELWKDIFEEQIMIYNKTNANLTIDDIHKMAKLDSLLKEILRHSFPVVLKTTMNNESYTFNTGAKIPKGRVVVVYAADSHFNSRVYNDPEIFQPNRYLTFKY